MKFTGIAALALAGSVSAAAIPVVDTTVQSTLSQLTGVLGKVDNVVGGLVGCATTDLTDLKDELSTIEGKLTQLLPSNKRDLTGTVGGVATPVVGIAGDAAGTVKGVASGAVNTVGNVAGGAVNTVEGVASPVVKTVGGVASPVVKTVGGAVDSVASPVVNAAGGAVGTVKGAASGVVSGAVNLKRDITDLSGLSETLVAKIQSGDLTAGALEKVLDLLSQNGGLANLQSVLSLV
ncbi:uncharacterized protein AKAW2_10684S [Aspergillus luchuensis]|uniref:Cell wall protein n=2 Tax=Aspergillus kawachii TaxID=1069201 RepID=A0A146FCH7_ASPKA|nr:uncharacterized protein AKAW2_10684S [Aspergillus luchuensis]OJZ89455.1 hypothetical protein ASPFODRAFT_204447 [Aspergillus luchuensis CBS 106.47]GAA88951.1 hypothetical protein AKAW_07065 [Aspergillus luchuensis IFO 4308]BCR93638.1 hypothetical protein AKAW2_10684S [Aspergillus luchuensis]BCS06268.1 hypothetical protein ALUC_10649S [Aspergillus luchuensis]GAT23567.1 hypothetical protein RIB2604_01707060 [Aspergillus luchuensis]